MKAGTLNKRHPCCDPDLFRRYEALYKGGVAFRRLVGEFLQKNPLEPQELYDLRKRDACYRSYVGPIVDFFAAELFIAPFEVRATVDGGPLVPDLFYAHFREDVDGVGTDLAAFMKRALVNALVKQRTWILAEVPDDGDEIPEAKSDWLARGLDRARVCALATEDVLDWECDDAGALQWVITHKREMRRDDPRLERTLVTETWKIYDTQDVETFQVVYDPSKRTVRPEDEIPSLGRRPHRFTRVPLVQLELPEGMWLLNRAADAQVAHFRLSAGMDWAITRTCYPMGVFKCKNKDDPPVTGPGYLQMIDVEEAFEWVTPTNAPFDVLSKEISVKKDEIYRIAQQMAGSVENNAAGLGRSGESKEADQTATEISLYAYGTLVKGAVEALLELVSDARGDTEVKFSVEGMDHFSLADVARRLEQMKAARDLGIPSQTLEQELWSKAAELLLPDASQAVKDRIRKEIQAAREGTPPPPNNNTAN